MGLIKDQIKEKTKTAGSKEAAVRDSKEWYATALKTLKNKNVVKNAKAFVPGKIYVFRYTLPKTKETLEWWDKNPVVLALDTHNGNDIGINLNLLPQNVKETLLDDVYTRLYGQIKTNMTRANENAGAQRNLTLTWDGAKKYLEKYNAVFALRQYIPSLKENQAIVSYEHWADIALCDFIELQGASVIDIIKAFKKQYNNKNI
jgi:hypothetical protein